MRDFLILTPFLLGALNVQAIGTSRAYIAPEDRRLYRFIDAIEPDSVFTEAERTMLNKAARGLVPNQRAERGSGFFLKLPGLESTPILVTSARPFGQFVSEYSQAPVSGLHLARVLDPADSPVKFSYSGLTRDWQVSAALKGSASLLFMPPTDVYDPAMTENFLFSRVLTFAEVERKVLALPVSSKALKGVGPGWSKDEAVWVLGFPVSRQSYQLAVSRGHILENATTQERLAELGHDWQSDYASEETGFVDAPGVLGMAGGPVLNAAGEVVGILQEGYYAEDSMQGAAKSGAVRRGETVSRFISIKYVIKRWWESYAQVSAKSLEDYLRKGATFPGCESNL